MIGIPIQIPFSIGRFSIHSGVYNVVGIGGTLGAQEGKPNSDAEEGLLIFNRMTSEKNTINHLIF